MSQQQQPPQRQQGHRMVRWRTLLGPQRPVAAISRLLQHSSLALTKPRLRQPLPSRPLLRRPLLKTLNTSLMQQSCTLL